MPGARCAPGGDVQHRHGSSVSLAGGPVILVRLLSVDYSLFGRDSLRMSGARNPLLVEAFANIVREARQAAGITQEQLAHDAGIDRTYIGLLENGRRQPSLSVIFSIAHSLGLAPELLVRRTRERAHAGNVHGLSA